MYKYQITKIYDSYEIDTMYDVLEARIDTLKQDIEKIEKWIEDQRWKK